jgi:hypothetical protein
VGRLSAHGDEREWRREIEKKIICKREFVCVREIRRRERIDAERWGACLHAVMRENN